jgi:arginine decarboxylase
VQYSRMHAYAWCTPGHTGGTAFLKTPVSRVFFDYFGERLFRSDLSISMGELGSLLDHSGAIGEGERYAASVFGSHRTYTVTNGSSTSNRVILMASLTDGDIALCDRNCHKSSEHGMTLTGAIPVYLVPHRNRYGIIGPIYPELLTPAAIARAVFGHPLAATATDRKPRHVVIANSTYDGLTYRVPRVLEQLGEAVDRVHFDEAWYAYARFHPLYRDRHAMFGDPATYTGPTLFATHSTHKLLAALSQASFIHVRDGRDPIEHGRFNESFMMHASTSPQYAIIASNDVTAAMMDGSSGPALTGESIREAIAFRQTVGRLGRELRASGEWFFSTWNPEAVGEPGSGRRVAFEDAAPDLLATEPDCWVLHPGDAWHGFEGIEDGYCMLDPIKVTLLTPGVAPDGSIEPEGIPATLVTAYLDAAGIIVEKTQDFSILFLFSIGITKGKWGSLLTALLDFKKDHDANRPLEQVFPALVAEHPRRYAGMGLRDLAAKMLEQYRVSGQMASLQAAFSTLPEAVMTPRAAYRALVRDEVEHVALDAVAGRVLATGVVPYPPGIPMVMPGERIGSDDGPYVSYLRALRDWDRRFPGFGHDTHGVEVEDGEYQLYCLKG